MASMTFQRSTTVAGKAFRHSRTVEGDNRIESSKSYPAAKTGILTTRTDNDTGTITGQSGHEVTTGAILDVYWSGGCRRGMTVGTVSGTSIPIDGGSGDNLPAQDVAVTLMVPLVETSGWAFAGNDLSAMMANCPAPFVVVFLSSGEAELGAIVFSRSGGGTYSFYNATDETTSLTNILSGDTVAKVRASHGDATAARDINIQVLVN